MLSDKEKDPTHKKSTYHTQLKMPSQSTYPGMNRGQQQQHTPLQPQYEQYPRSFPQTQAQYLDQYTSIQGNNKKTNQLLPLSVSAERLVCVFTFDVCLRS